MPGIGLSTALWLAGVALAGTDGPSAGRQAVEPGTGRAMQAIDGQRSQAHFIVRLRFRGAVVGRMGGVAGQLRGDAVGGWSVAVRMDAGSLRMEGPRWMERATRSPAFLAVDRYPAIRFESAPFDDAVLRGGGPVQGELLLRGLRRPVSFQLLPSECARPGRDCDIRVQGSLSRRDFGMSAHRAMVDDRVELQLRVRLHADEPGS
jgi:polyisoprenoid-binding protein YceI